MKILCSEGVQGSSDLFYFLWSLLFSCLFGSLLSFLFGGGGGWGVERGGSVQVCCVSHFVSLLAQFLLFLVV